MNAPQTAQHLMPAIAQRDVPQALIDTLKSHFGDRCSTAMAVREQHGRDESAYTTVPPPAAVVFAQSTEDVAFTVRHAAEHNVPIIPFGVGSSLEGHLLAVQGGISIDLGRMNKVLTVNPEDLTVTVQPGVTRKQLNEEIKSTGLFFPIDPGADASIGGMSATRASGTNAVRYGTMRENVLGLEVVTASGDVIRTGTRARKSSAGYDLTRLMVGSEGTLGVELIDQHAVRMVNAYSKINLPVQPMLLMEFHGSPASVKEQAESVQDIAAELGGQAFEWATTPEDRTRLWTARHNAYFAAIQSRPGCRAISTDTCVPISRLADCLLDSIAEVEASGIPYFLVGHVGDGNFHFGYLIDPDSAQERATAETLNNQLVARALALDGTCTGEHGIGLHKMDFLVSETGIGAVSMMRAIKQALDPKNIMNPGKIFLD